MGDIYDIRMIYPNKYKGQHWHIKMLNALNDDRFRPNSKIYPITHEGKIVAWRCLEPKVRLEVLTDNFYKADSLNTNQSTLLTRKYMQDSLDWTNVEMTGYVKVLSRTEDAAFAWYARGGKHSAGISCEGTGYKGVLHYSGRVRAAKESRHAYYKYRGDRESSYSPIKRWMGLKVAIFNDKKNRPNVELWVNPSLDRYTWIRIVREIDDGGWGEEGNYCKGMPDQPITWGGPIATFRWDNAEVDFKWLSIREIRP